MSTTNAATFTGRVVRIVDGDTLTVLNDEKREIRVRLAGIDAPEHSQAWGERSRQYLASLAFAKRVSVEWYKTSYNRVIGVVIADGVDISLAQVKVGLAWHYKRYEAEQAPKDRQAYAAAELEARKERRGLWQDPEPIPPWDFRRRRY
uniref:thermonuclease family protein n=1 Tax=Cupriavidus sp. WGlv3 TaxID=2919924 RepID=UPI0035325679